MPPYNPQRTPLQAPQPIAMPEVQGGQTYTDVNQDEYTDFLRNLMSFSNEQGGFNIPLMDFLSSYFNKPDFVSFVLSPPGASTGFVPQDNAATFAAAGEQLGKAFEERKENKQGKSNGEQAPAPAIKPGQPPTPPPESTGPRPQRFKGYTPPIFEGKQFVPDKWYRTPKGEGPGGMFGIGKEKMPKFPSEGGPGAQRWQQWLDELKKQGSSPGVQGPTPSR